MSIGSAENDSRERVSGMGAYHAILIVASCGWLVTEFDLWFGGHLCRLRRRLQKKNAY